MRVLAIDDCEITLESMRVFLETEIPGVEFTEYSSMRLGRPGRDFNWAAYDVLLLDYDLGAGQTGLDWLPYFVDHPGFPATVLITGVADSYVVANAIKRGVAGYLNKDDLTPQRLTEVIYEVLAHPTCDTRSASILADVEAEQITTQDFAMERTSKGHTGIVDYRFGEIIGNGRYSKVYKAERVPDGETVAIKILDRSVAHAAENVQRFTREGELVSWVDSPFVVNVFEQGLANRFGYIVMEFFEGGDLKQRIAKGIAPDKAMEYLYDIALALQATHDAGVVHRDLKPANVMFRRDGTIALMNFGVAKRIGKGMDLTHVGTVIGTPYYVSPEQAQGMPVDEKSDLYNLGLLLYEMLTGEKPYLGDTASALLFQHVHSPVPELPQELARFQPLLAGLMAKDRRKRFADVPDLFASLAAFDAA
jgi:DNA-binding NarL/FixJ family response regulator/tRNA A-37 threonylcarbamoyl transferase component Bud32